MAAKTSRPVVKGLLIYGRHPLVDVFIVAKLIKTIEFVLSCLVFFFVCALIKDQLFAHDLVETLFFEIVEQLATDRPYFQPLRKYKLQNSFTLFF